MQDLRATIICAAVLLKPPMVLIKHDVLEHMNSAEFWHCAEICAALSPGVQDSKLSSTLDELQQASKRRNLCGKPSQTVKGSLSLTFCIMANIAGWSRWNPAAHTQHVNNYSYSYSTHITRVQLPWLLVEARPMLQGMHGWTVEALCRHSNRTGCTKHAAAVAQQAVGGCCCVIFTAYVAGGYHSKKQSR